LLDLGARLATAEAAIPELERQRRPLLLDADAGLPGAADELARVTQLLADTRQVAADVRDMIAEATEREAETNAAAREALCATQLNAVRQHLRLRDEATETFVRLQADAIAAWRLLVRHSEAARAACPVGRTWPVESLCLIGEVIEATAVELYRVGAHLDDIGRNVSGFPGGAVADFRLRGAPGALTPLLDKVRGASARVLAYLTGKEAAANGQPGK
jgi:hypothetical protein